MNHSLFARSELDECTKLFNAYDFTCKNLTCLEICYDDADQLCCTVHHVCVCTTDRYGTVICNVDLNTSLLDDGIDGLSSLTNNITDLLRIDLHGDDLRCIFSNLCSRLSDRRFHNFIQNVKSCFTCSCNSFLYDRSCQSVDLDIHLDCCDTVMCSGYFKVHIAKEIFQTLDICQNDVIIICLACYQTTGNTCNRFLDRYTCCHQRHGRCTDTCLRSRSIGLKCLRYSTDCIREFFLARKYRY